MTPAARRSFTGWHMTLTLALFFGVVVAVNLVMARLAVGTFGGTVVPNSYVASQKFNGWLAEGRRQAELGWRTEVKRDSAGRLRVQVCDRDGAVLAGLSVSAHAVHPLGQAEGKRLAFDGHDGAYVSRTALPAGRWLVTVTLRRGADRQQIESRLN
jgi:nitrogen fixation protein FixH